MDKAPHQFRRRRTCITRARVRIVLTLIADHDSVRAVLCRRRLERILIIDAETVQRKRQIADLVAPPAPP